MNRIINAFSWIILWLITFFFGGKYNYGFAIFTALCMIGSSIDEWRDKND